MYRIMTVEAEKKNFASLYKWLVAVNDEGQVVPVEFEDEASLDAFVDEMLNEGGYAKKDFIIVKQVEYTIDAKDYHEVETDGEEVPDEPEP